MSVQSPCDFSLSALNVYINTDVSGRFFIDGDTTGPSDMLITVEPDQILHRDVSSMFLNKVFWFFTNNDLSDSIAEDLNDDVATDFKYAFWLNQWNVAINTNKSERKEVIEAALADLFGNVRANALRNVDVFSNEDELDTDIDYTFMTRVHELQRHDLRDQAAQAMTNRLYDGCGNYLDRPQANHGCFDEQANLVSSDDGAGSVGMTVLNAGVFFENLFNAAVPHWDNSGLSDVSAQSQPITKRLLQQAAAHAFGTTKDVFKRQFSDTNTVEIYHQNSSEISNYDVNSQWRTFNFIEGDTLTYDVVMRPNISQYPDWHDASYNAAKYRIVLHVNDSGGANLPAVFSGSTDLSLGNITYANGGIAQKHN